MKTGRNDPCPCGSGKKLKHCCLRAAQTTPAAPKPPAESLQLASAWLQERHRAAFATALEELLQKVSPRQTTITPRQLDAQTSAVIQTNLVEWLIAEGEWSLRGIRQRVRDTLLGPGGPELEASQSRWIEQLGLRPLRLYEVTDVMPGVQMTLRDALDPGVAPVVVQERSGTQTMRVGTQIAGRIMQVNGHHELSGAAYSFSTLAGPRLLAQLREPTRQPGPASLAIMAAWLAQYLGPSGLPQIRHPQTGEAILLVIDHYEVPDWTVLTTLLDACPELDRDPDDGWDRRIESGGGRGRSIAYIHQGSSRNRLEILYQTQGQADAGRSWFDSLAGPAVKFLTRERTDLVGLTKHG